MLKEYYEHMTHALMHIPDMGEESNSVWYHLSPQEWPCLDPKSGSWIRLSEHCSNFCFVVQKIVQKLIN
jgi:hypothetical protein